MVDAENNIRIPLSPGGPMEQDAQVKNLSPKDPTPFQRHPFRRGKTSLFERTQEKLTLEKKLGTIHEGSGAETEEIQKGSQQKANTIKTSRSARSKKFSTKDESPPKKAKIDEGKSSFDFFSNSPGQWGVIGLKDREGKIVDENLYEKKRPATYIPFLHQEVDKLKNDPNPPLRTIKVEKKQGEKSPVCLIPSSISSSPGSIELSESSYEWTGKSCAGIGACPGDENNEPNANVGNPNHYGNNGNPYANYGNPYENYGPANDPSSSPHEGPIQQMNSPTALDPQIENNHSMVESPLFTNTLGSVSNGYEAQNTYSYTLGSQAYKLAVAENPDADLGPLRNPDTPPISPESETIVGGDTEQKGGFELTFRYGYPKPMFSPGGRPNESCEPSSSSNMYTSVQEQGCAKQIGGVQSENKRNETHEDVDQQKNKESQKKRKGRKPR